MFQVAGLAITAAGVYVRFTKTEYDALLGASMIPVTSYVMIGGGALVTFVSIAGFGGAACENRKLLTVYLFCIALVFLVEAAVAVLGFMYYEQMRVLLDEHVKMAILQKYGYEEFNIISEGVNFMQQELDCCGYQEPEDWAISKYFNDTETAADRGSSVVPISCCVDMLVAGCNHNIDNKVHPEGCAEKLESLLKNNLLLVGTASVSVAMVQVVAFIMALSLCKKTKDYVLEF
ncbi:cd63 antigen [Mactra antiquata]